MNNQSIPTFLGQVSYFRNVTDSEPLEISINRFLYAIQSGQYENTISRIRACKIKKERTRIKQALPAISTSALYNSNRLPSNLYALSGLISIDIDNLNNVFEVKRKLSDDIYTFAAFISPSGNGLKLIVKADYTIYDFIETFYSLEDYYKKNYNLTIDKACKDISRLMFISHDEHTFINPNSLNYVHKLTPKKLSSPDFKPSGIQSNYNFTERLINQIEAFKIDITASYPDWLKIAFALVNEFGINGLDYFLRISRFYPGFDVQEASKQYNKCYQQGSKFITIKSLYSIAKDYGVTFKN